MTLRLLPRSRKAENDNEDRFRLIIRQYQEPLYRHIRRIAPTHEDAEDALQETFIRAYQHIDDLRDQQSQKAWLYRIATNEALRVCPKHTAGDMEIDPPADDTPDYEALQQALDSALHTLPPRQRAVFTMRYYEDMSYDDIALALNTNVKAATANYHLAKDKIRQILLQL